MKLAIHADMEVRAVALARMAVFMISTGLSGQLQASCDREVQQNLLDP